MSFFTTESADDKPEELFQCEVRKIKRGWEILRRHVDRLEKMDDTHNKASQYVYNQVEKDKLLATSGPCTGHQSSD
jgi:hypothetical protein